MEELFPAITSVMEQISDKHSDWGNETVIKANGLLHSMTNFQFIAALIITKHILVLTRPLTVKLQSRSADIMSAHVEIELTKSTLANIRENIVTIHKEWYTQAEKLAAGVSIEPAKCPK